MALAVAVSAMATACGGNVFTTATDSDAGVDGSRAGGAGAGTGGRGTGGVRGTGGQSSGGRPGAGGLTGAGGFTGAGGKGGATGAGGAAGSCGIDCSYLDDACHKGICTSVGCAKVLIPDGQSCDDHSLCTSGETCQSGVCTGGVSVACVAPPGACQTSVCDPSTGQCAVKSSSDGAPCNDSNACTSGDTCKGGICVGNIAGCVSGDGCCPASCTSSNDSDCGTTGTCTNIALMAVATSSGGGSGNRGPTVMNDGVGESSCEFGWVFDGPSATGAWIELSWPSPVTIGSTYVETANASSPSCGATVPRNLQSGRIQYMAGGQWVDVASFGGFTDDVRVDLSSPVTTTDLRIFDMTTAAGGANTMVFEWHVYPESGCKPPP